jgi:hypothetical protein
MTLGQPLLLCLCSQFRLRQNQGEGSSNLAEGAERSTCMPVRVFFAWLGIDMNSLFRVGRGSAEAGGEEDNGLDLSREQDARVGDPAAGKSKSLCVCVSVFCVWPVIDESSAQGWWQGRG